MFERFTDRARRVLVVAQDEASNLDHSFIGPEHLLLGLVQGEGMAAQALGQLGVSLEELRAKVAATVKVAGTVKPGTRASKVPFSREAKRALELSLREALRLGHNYIGTEHILLGVLRVADGDGAVTKLLGVEAHEVRARVGEVMSKGFAQDSRQSPALVGAMQRARELAGSRPMTTGQLLLAMLADDACQAKKALAMLDVSAESLEAPLAQIPLGGTSDAPPRPRAVEIKLGQVTTTIDDPDLAAALSELTSEQLGAALREAFGINREPPASALGS
jgi:ATP-dependent Clp protease ATP-binding subunit ClpA